MRGHSPARFAGGDSRFTVDDEEDDANEFTLPINPLTELDALDDLPAELRHAAKRRCYDAPLLTDGPS
jgi:hypothetical protein